MYQLNTVGGKEGDSFYKIEEQLTESNGVEKTEISTILYFLGSIFSGDKKNSSFAPEKQIDKRSIVYPSSFRRYFAYALMIDEFSEVEFSEARHGSLEDFKIKIDKWIGLNLEKVVRKTLEDVHTFDNREDFENIIKVIFYLGGRYSVIERYASGLVGFNSDNIAFKLNNKVVADGLYKKGELKKFVVDVFNSAPGDRLFERATLQVWLKNAQKGFLFSKAEIFELLLGYLSEQIDEAADYEKEIFGFCIDLLNFEGYFSTNEKVFSGLSTKAKNLFINYVSEKGLNKFILSIIHPTGENYYKLDLSVIRVWENTEKFAQIISNLESSKSPYLAEFTGFLIVLLSNVDKAKAIKFTFLDTPVKSI
jgi:hypothetical protein